MMNLELLLNCNPRAELARRHLIDFVSYTKEDYETNWHHLLLCKYLEEFYYQQDFNRLMVFMPPQHGKSELVSRRFPAFVLGKNPRAKIIVSSYSAVLASSFNRDVQRIIDSQQYHDVFPETILSESNVVTISDNWLRNSEIFEIVKHGGFYKAVGVGGSLTGTPADIAIIDDPVKDSIEAQSPTYKQRNWEWYNDVLSTRLHNKSKILLTMTRWAEDDLAGMILKSSQERGGEKWRVLHLPAIKENDLNSEDPRKIGEALWPQRHSLERLLNVQKQSARTFFALYQQNPKPVETGGEFYKEFKIHKHVGKAAYNPAQALHISFDENVVPYLPCGVFQIEGKKISMIKEFCGRSPNNTYKAVCNMILKEFRNHTAGLFIYGDATSQKEDAKLEKGYDFFRLIMDHLSPMKPRRRVAASNPSVIMRGNFINTILESNFEDIELLIDQDCKETINDFLYTKEDADGTKLKEKAKDVNTGASYQKYGHMTDLTDYVICYAFSKEYQLYQTGTKPHQMSGGRLSSTNRW